MREYCPVRAPVKPANHLEITIFTPLQFAVDPNLAMFIEDPHE